METPKLTEDQRTRIGTLYDREIEELASNGKLITEGFDRNFVKQACYELRAGSVYYDLASEAERIEVDADEFILIKPRQSVVIIAFETVVIPDDMLARILTKGKLFSIGLLPVNTYADPGFDGNLGIVFFNASTQFLKIMPGEPIAKIEFTRLEHPVHRPYHGQHGYHTQIWPIPTEMILTEEEIQKDKRILSTDRELQLSYGSEISKVVKTISRYYRWLILASCLYFTLVLGLFVLVTQQFAVTIAIGVAVGIVANIVTFFFMSGATNFSRRRLWSLRN